MRKKVMGKLIFTLVAACILMQGCRCAKQSRREESFGADSSRVEVMRRNLERFDTARLRRIVQIDSVVMITVTDTVRRRTVIHGITERGAASSGTRVKAAATDTVRVTAHKEFTGQSESTARCENSFPWYWVVVALVGAVAAVTILRAR